MKRRPILILTTATACGIAAAHLAGVYLRTQASAAPAPSIVTTLVAVAARDLPSGSVLQPEDVKLVEWPAHARPTGHLASAEALVGQGLLLPVRAHEPLLKSKLAGSGVGGLATIIPRGMRAVSVKVDEVIAVAGFVVPGTRVDVLLTMASGGDRAGASRAILQNIKVLAAGQSFEPTAQGKPQDASVITLLVTPHEAEVLALAATEGRIQLALRNTLDEVVAADGAGPPSPAPLRASARPAPPAPGRQAPRPPGLAVEVYHGSARTVTSF